MGEMLGIKPKKDRKAEAALKEQERKEQQRIAEEKSELAKRRSRGKNHMSGLIKTSQQGVVQQGKTKLSGIV